MLGVLLVGGLREALELVDVAAVVRDDHSGALGGIVTRAAADGDDAVALLALIERRGVHAVVVLGVRLDLVVENDVDTLVFDLADEFFDDSRSAQTGGHQQDTAHTEVLGLDSEHVVRADTEFRVGEGMEILDREVPDLVQLDGHDGRSPCIAVG